MHPAVERLHWLRDYLATVNPHLFDMRTFFSPEECGTHMCIGGHMANVPQLKELGYSLTSVLPSDPEHWIRTPRMGDLQGSRAIQRALLIEDFDVHNLCYVWNGFEPHGEAALKLKLAQIDRLITRYQGVEA